MAENKKTPSTGIELPCKLKKTVKSNSDQVTNPLSRHVYQYQKSRLLANRSYSETNYDFHLFIFPPALPSPTRLIILAHQMPPTRPRRLAIQTNPDPDRSVDTTPPSPSPPPPSPTIPPLARKPAPNISTTMFTIKGFYPYISHNVYVTLRKNCHTAHDICRYLLLSLRVRRNLLTYAINVPEFHKRKLFVYHPLLPYPIILSPTRSDELFLRRIRTVFYDLPPKEIKGSVSGVV